MMADILTVSGLLPGLLAFVLAAVLVYLLTPSSRRLALHLGAVDLPEGRRAHGAPTPRLGGVALTLGAVVAVVLVMPVFMVSSVSEISPVRVAVFLSATALIFATGFVDDVRGLKPGQKFLAQLVAAGTVLAVGGAIEHLTLPFVGPVDLGPAGYLVSLLWIVGITNAVNLIDGLDGLAGGVSLIIAGSIAIISLLQGSQPATVLVAAALAGACLGFLPHNWTPASIFMGDSGSLTMGFTLAVLTHSSSIKSSTTVAILVPLLALGLPAIDTLLVMVFRFATGPQDSFTRRVGRMFKADRQHVHHLLLNVAPKRGTVVVLLYAIVSVFCAAALVASLTKNIPLGMALLLLEGGVIIVIRKAGMKAAARTLAATQREEARKLLVPDEILPQETYARARASATTGRIQPMAAASDDY